MGETKFIDLQIQSEMINSDSENIGYQLYARSSISKTPLVLHNSVGIIDAGYRGNLKAAVTYIPSLNDLMYIQNETLLGFELVDMPYDDLNNKQFICPTYRIKKGTRLFQICKFTGEPFKIKLVDELSDSSRGTGGFGSTGA